jgi:hypothetical protein
VRELVTTAPPGFAVLALDNGSRRRVASFFAPLRRSLGDSWRGFDARLLVHRGTRTGAIVTVMDASKMSGGAVDVLAGAQAGARSWGNRLEKIEVAGAEGRLTTWPDGGTTAVALTDRCALVLILGDAAMPVRRVARALPAS